MPTTSKTTCFAGAMVRTVEVDGMERGEVLERMREKRDRCVRFMEERGRRKEEQTRSKRFKTLRPRFRPRSIVGYTQVPVLTIVTRQLVTIVMDEESEVLLLLGHRLRYSLRATAHIGVLSRLSHLVVPVFGKSSPHLRK